MKHKFNHRLLAAIIALVMVAQMLPAALLVSATESALHVLDATADLTAMDAGAKADGDTEVVGDYFTITYSAKTKIDGSSKTFDDGYTATQRLNFGGKTNTEGMFNSVKFTTSAAATVKIWWVSGGDGRNFAIYDETGQVLVSTTEESVKNSLYISTLELAAAGTYYLGVPDGSNYLFKLEVAEASAAGGDVEEKPESTEYVFHSLQDVNLGTTEDKAVIPEGTTFCNGFFTVVGKMTQRWQESKGGVYAVEIAKNGTGAMQFTIENSANATFVVSSTGSSNISTVALINVTTGKVIANAEGALISEISTTAATTLTYQGLEAGTYQLVSPQSDYDRGFRLMSIRVEVQGQNDLPVTGDVIGLAAAALVLSAVGIVATVPNKKRFF